MSNYKCRTITLGIFWAVYPFKPGRSPMIHWNRKIPSNSFISLGLYLLWMNQHVTAHFGWKGHDKKGTCGWSMFSLRVSEYTNTWSMVWFVQQRQSCCLTICFTNRGECPEGIGNFAGAEVLSVITWDIKDSLALSNNGERKLTTDWERERER